MIKVPKGNTQKDVSAEVFKILDSSEPRSLATIIDVPCGDGTFAKFLKDSFPEAHVVGVDKFCEVPDRRIEFFKLGAQDFFRSQCPKNIDAITSISGVMCFDVTEELLSLVHAALKKNGLVVITNDNIMTVRDKLNFLFFSHFKRFKLTFAKHEGNWNLLLPQAVYMLLERHNFRVQSIRYTSIYVEDWIFLPYTILKILR